MDTTTWEGDTEMRHFKVVDVTSAHCALRCNHCGHDFGPACSPHLTLDHMRRHHGFILDFSTWISTTPQRGR